MWPRRLVTPLMALLVVFAGGCTTPATTDPTTPSTSRPAAPGPVVIKPTIEGWHPVRSVKRAAVYDVPPSWTVLSEGTVAGYETKSGTVVASGAAEFGENACGGGRGSRLALAGIRHATYTDLAEASQSIATEWADRAYRDAADRSPTLTTAAPEMVTSVSGKPAAIVKVTAILTEPTGPCHGTTGTVYAISATGFTGELGPTVVLVIVADTGVPGAVSETEIRQILTTLRPAP